MTTLSRHLRPLCGGLRAAALATLSIGLFLALSATASAREVRIGTAPVLPQDVTLLASEASVGSVGLTIALEPRDPAALAAYAGGVSSPGTKDFHRFLTTAEFRARFGPTAATIRAVDRSLRAHGLHPGRVDASGLSLHVSASSGQISRAFDLTLSRVRLRDGRDAIYNVQAPAVDASIAGDIQAVMGLSTLYPEQATVDRQQSSPLLDAIRKAQERESAHSGADLDARVATGGPQPCSTAVDDAPGSGGYTADQVASYYDFSPLYEAGDLGQGVTIALYELEPNLTTDVAAFQQCYGTDTSVSYVKVDKGSGTGAGSGEAALDIDQIISFAPKAKLLVYEGPNTNSGTGPYDTYAAIANQDKASIVSSSWGTCEPEETATAAQAENTLFEQMAAQGQTMVSAAGDSGAEDCFVAGPGGDSDNALQVDDPASQPFVTGVGGTSLELGPFDTAGNPDETVWNNSDPSIDYSQWGIAPGAGGGGLSSFWQMPSFQSDSAVTAPWLDVQNSESLPTSGASACASSTIQAPAAGTTTDYCREVPDVSANADPMDGYMSYWNGNGRAGTSAISGWQGVGGTSAAAPLWAAVFAIAEASSACDDNRIGFADPSLYALAASSQTAYDGYFNDITADASSSDAAGDDNDLASSGNSSQLYQAGTGYDMATGLGSPNVANLAPALCREALRVSIASSRQNWIDQTVDLHLKAALPTGITGPVTYSARGLPKGLQINPTTGVISGTVSTLGVYSAEVSATTSSGYHGAHAVTWIVAKRPMASQISLSAAHTGRPQLSLTIRGGTDEPALHAVTITLPTGMFLEKPLRDISVTTAAGLSVPHKLAILDGQLVVTLTTARPDLKILFRPGSLGAHGALLAGSTAPVQLSLRVEDLDNVIAKRPYTVTPTA